MNDVMDRHHRPARSEDRQNVMGRVEKVDAQSPQGGRNSDVLTDRVIGGSDPDGSEVRVEGADQLLVLPIAQEKILGLLVDARQVLDQVANIRADAEVVDLPDVEGDSHRTNLLKARLAKPRPCSNGSARNDEVSVPSLLGPDEKRTIKAQTAMDGAKP